MLHDNKSCLNLISVPLDYLCNYIGIYNTGINKRIDSFSPKINLFISPIRYLDSAYVIIVIYCNQ